MTSLPTSAFALPDHLAAKAGPALIAADDQHFAEIADSLRRSIADLTERLDAARRAPGGIGQEALDRDLEIHRLTARLRTLRRFGLDLCLGRIVSVDDPRARLHRAPGSHRQHGPAAAARLALPRGRAVLRGDPRQPDGSDEPPQVPLGPRPDRRLLGRGVRPRRVRGNRRVRGARRARRPVRLHRRPGQQPVRPDARRARHHPGRPGRHHPGGIAGRAGRRRRAGHGQDRRRPAPRRVPPLRRLPPRSRRGGVLFVGPHEPYLAYVADVLPSLGEEGVPTCTLRDLVPEGAGAAVETRPGDRPPESRHGRGGGDRDGGPVLRGAADQGDDGGDRLGRSPARRGRLGRGVPDAGPRHPAQRGPRPDLGGAAHDPRRQLRRRGIR